MGVQVIGQRNGRRAYIDGQPYRQPLCQLYARCPWRQTPPYGTLWAASSTEGFTGYCTLLKTGCLTGVHGNRYVPPRLTESFIGSFTGKLHWSLGASLDDLLDSSTRRIGCLHNPSKGHCESVTGLVSVAPLKHGPRGHRPTDNHGPRENGRRRGGENYPLKRAPWPISGLQSRFGHEKPGTSSATNL